MAVTKTSIRPLTQADFAAPEVEHDDCVPVELPPAPATNRDELIAALKREREAAEKELAILQPKLDAAIAELEAIDEPRRRRERLGQEVARVRGHAIAIDQSLRNQIAAAAPGELRLALRDLKRQLESRQGSAWERCQNAIMELEKLVLVPGDLKPAIKKVFQQLAQGDFDAIK